ncbi:MAG: hypothetical protein EPN85_01975 [Bacteroidetes bacterium]|nr:MAG: hypothetical protein EPN85_01975 [Bacteroidota bacterium]
MKKQLFLLVLVFIGMLNLSSAQQDDGLKNRNVRSIGYQIGGLSAGQGSGIMVLMPLWSWKFGMKVGMIYFLVIKN